MSRVGCFLALALLSLAAAFGQSAPPAITVQPASTTANAGQSVTLSLTATGSPTPTIQWLKDGKAIASATNSSLTFASVFGGDAGTYTATVSNVYNGSTYTLTTTPAVLTVITTPPTINTQPMSQTVVAGGNVTFSVTATGSEPISYRWYRDGVELAGAATSSLTIVGVQPGDSGGYRASVSNWANQVKNASAGEAHTMFLKVDGTLWGVGNNGSGRLGDGTTTSRLTPVQVASGVESVEVGGFYTMFLKVDGTLWGIGYNNYGQLGDGTTTNRSTPVQVATGVASVSAANSHTMFLKTDGSLWGVGYNNYSQLGDGTTTTSATPVQVASGVASVSAGNAHTMFIKNDGTLWGVGYNGGRLGDGTTTSRSTPVQVATGVASVSAGFDWTMYVKTDGTLWGAGFNGYGQLGDGTTTSRSTPVQVASGVARVSAGAAHTMYLKTDGTLWGMGYNGFGVLGDGTTTNRSTPVQVATGVASVSAGNHTIFIKDDGSLWGIGRNDYGQLGDGTAATRTTPVRGPGGLLSGVATLTVNAAPVVTALPANVTIPNGERTQLNVSATGAGALTYQWYQGQSGTTATPVIGATSPTFTTPTLTATTSYWVRIADGNGAIVNSPTVTVTVSATSPLTVTQQIVGSGYSAGGGVIVTNTITYSGTAPSRIDWATLLPAGWKYLGSGGSEGGVRPTYKNADLIEWSWTSVPASPIEFTYMVSVPVGTIGDQVIASLVSSQAAGSTYQTMAKPDPLVIRSGSNHSADTNRDWKISLTELTRVIELYNYRSGSTRTGEYHISAGTEDGFAPGPVPYGFVLIPAGTFAMGSNVSANTADITDGLPYSNVRQVSMASFMIARAETTWGEWKIVRDWAVLNGYADLANVGKGRADDHPVNSVSWFDVVKWLNARSEKEGLTPVYYTNDALSAVYRSGEVNVTNDQVKWSANGYRLPTEAEWELAARGGASGKRFSWGDTVSFSDANYSSFYPPAYDSASVRGFHPQFLVPGVAAYSQTFTSPVASFRPNGFGIYDMSGNIAEWCWDWWVKSYDQADISSPKGPRAGELSNGIARRVFRGGNWGMGAEELRVGRHPDYFGNLTPSTRDNDGMGFRSVRSYN